MLEHQFIEFAELLADTARNIIKPLFRTQIAVNAKQDQSPVTIADRNAEFAMRELIMQKYPHHGIFGEEFGEYQTNAEYI
ncbi:MAG: inositol monophosphatase family protein, partial [Pseudomonadota bacterium]